MDLFEKIYCKNFSMKDKSFNDRLERIEQEYMEFFKASASKFTYEQHDQIQNHYLIFYNSERIKFGFNDNTDISKNIIQSCLDVFN